MPRNSSGNYTLPSGNPVVPGTVITTDWANNTLDDIAFQLNGVLTQDGLLYPSAPLTVVDGNSVFPGLSFTSSPATGLWNSATASGFSFSGIAYLEADATGMSLLGFKLKSGVPAGEAAVGQLTVGGLTPNAAALLDIQSTTKGFKPPAMTTAQKLAIGNVAGLVVYDTDKGRLSTNNGTAWVEDPVADTGSIPQNIQSAAYTLVLADAGKHIFHPSADTTARIWTIPANASVAFPIGSAVTFVNQNAAGVITIAITSDTMRLAGSGATGNRTLAANGIATALKVTATEWLISGGSSLT